MAGARNRSLRPCCRPPNPRQVRVRRDRTGDPEQVWCSTGDSTGFEEIGHGRLPCERGSGSANQAVLYLGSRRRGLPGFRAKPPGSAPRA